MAAADARRPAVSPLRGSPCRWRSSQRRPSCVGFAVAAEEGTAQSRVATSSAILSIAAVAYGAPPAFPLPPPTICRSLLDVSHWRERHTQRAASVTPATVQCVTIAARRPESRTGAWGCASIPLETTKLPENAHFSDGRPCVSGHAGAISVPCFERRRAAGTVFASARKRKRKRLPAEVRRLADNHAKCVVVSSFYCAECPMGRR